MTAAPGARTPRAGVAPKRARTDRLTYGAAAAALLWAAAVLAYAVGFYATPSAPPMGGLGVLLFAATASAPAGLLLVCLAVLRRAEALAPPRGAQAESAAAHADIVARLDALTQALAALEARIATAPAPAAAPAAETDPPTATPTAKPTAKPTAQAHAPDPPAQPLAARAASAQQPDLPFADAAPGAGERPISWDDVARALDFPRDDHDAAGFAALQSAVRDPEIAKLLQAAEDVLSMLAAEGAHMEDMRPEHADLATWRAYAEGARGAAAAAIGGLRDAQALEAVGARLKRDAIFRDACFVFARRWGTFTTRVFRELGDDPLMLRIADSRSGRAFMLVGRAMGAFG